jgi:serine/threonine-protein phosphatase 4 regulatory subunit 1
VSLELSDLTLDDGLDDLHRIERYATSAIALQRLVHVKLMAETAREVG